MNLRSYMIAVLAGAVVRAFLHILLVFALLIAIGEALIHWPDMLSRFQSFRSAARARELVQPVETTEKSAKL